MIKTGPKRHQMGTNVPEPLPSEARGQAADAQPQGSSNESLAAGRENGEPGREERRETSKEFTGVMLPQVEQHTEPPCRRESGTKNLNGSDFLLFYPPLVVYVDKQPPCMVTQNSQSSIVQAHFKQIGRSRGRQNSEAEAGGATEL